jgi:hypothetical protein
MTGTVSLFILAVKFGYDRYGPKEAVTAAAAVRASLVLVRRDLRCFFLSGEILPQSFDFLIKGECFMQYLVKLMF